MPDIVAMPSVNRACRARRLRAGLILASWLLLATWAAAGVNVLVGAEAGVVWYFYHDTDAERIHINPQIAYGGQVTVISDFNWARNIALEASYFHSEGLGEYEGVKARHNRSFKLLSDQMFVGVSYFFGGLYYDPFINIGLGAARQEFQIRRGARAGTDDLAWDMSANIGGGIDFRLHKHVSLGLRIRYIWIMPTGFIRGHASGLLPGARFSVRF